MSQVLDNVDLALLRECVAFAIREGLEETPQQRRDRFAAAALTGLLAHHEPPTDRCGPNGHAQEAVRQADALIAELDKVKP